MHKYRIYIKGDQIHALLSSYNHPNTLIPVKAIVKDMKWDASNPKYKIKILKFYDSLQFLKKYLFNMNFHYDYTNKARKFRLKDSDFESVKEIEDALKGPDEQRFYLVVESVMCSRTKIDLKILFKKIHRFLISIKLKEIREISLRPFYDDEFRLYTKKEFKKRLYHYIGDNFEKTGEDFNRYADGL